MGNCYTSNPESEIQIQSEFVNSRIGKKQMAEFNENGDDSENKLDRTEAEG